MTPPTIDTGFKERDRGEIITLLREYEAGLGISLCFEDFDAEIAALPGAYTPPGGQILVARDAAGDDLIGCVALRAVASDPGACEMKRLYVRPAARRSGVGRHLATAVMQEARRLGYRRMVLDTLPWLRQAQTLYLSLGFRQTGTRGSDPMVLQFERVLDAP